MDFVPAVAMIALIVKLVDFARYLRAGDLNGVVTQLAAWTAGAVGMLLMSKTVWATAVPVNGTPLNQLGVWSIVFAGVTLASSASAFNDIKSAIDNTDSAAVPTLLPPRLARHRKE